MKELTERRLIMKKQLSFPQGFWWGAASSGPQTEGQFDKAHENVMDYWFRTDPEAFFNGVGPDVQRLWNSTTQLLKKQRKMILNWC